MLPRCLNGVWQCAMPTDNAIAECVEYREHIFGFYLMVSVLEGKEVGGRGFWGEHI